MVLDEQKEKVSKKVDERKIKDEERKLKIEEKKADAKLNIEEKKLNAKISHNDKKIAKHIEKADKKIDKALDNANKNIAKLLDAVDTEIAEDVEKPIELIIFKAKNNLEEIFLETQLKMQKAKNELIKNLEKDIKKAIELATIEEDLSQVKEKMDLVVGTLEGKIETEKEELNQKIDD